VFSLTYCTSPDPSLNSKGTSTIDKSENIKRIGMVIKLKEDEIEEYKRIHAENHHGVRDLLMKYNMRNFSIFLIRLEDGNYYEFGYYEYTGDNFDEDMNNLAAEPRNMEWLKVTDAMQVPLGGYESWAEMETIFFNP
jgi:L-rhamnose mutarotase